MAMLFFSHRPPPRIAPFLSVASHARMVSRDERYQNAMRNSDEQSARLESERALQQVIFAIMADNMELFKQFQDNPSFKKWLSDLVFNLTYNKEGKPYEPPQAGN